MGRSTWRHIAEEVYCVLMKLKVDSIFAKAMLGRCTTIHQYNENCEDIESVWNNDSFDSG